MPAKTCCSEVQLSHIGAPRFLAQNSPFSQAPVNTCKRKRSRHAGHIERPVQGSSPQQMIAQQFHMGVCTSRLQYLPSKEDEVGIGNGFNVVICKEGLIPIHDQQALVRFYENALENLQQVNCRILAKAYIKLVEPRKQVNYPYNGRKAVRGRTIQFDPEETKPPWWPSQVQHREPDHLPKVERIRLLVHILRELRISHGITVKKLKEADRAIRYQMRPQGRLHFLDEVYHVREQEERLLDKQAGWQMVEQPPYLNFSEATGKPGRTAGRGNVRLDGSDSNIQHTEPSTSVWGFDPMMHVPLAKRTSCRGFTKSMSSRHSVLRRGRGGNGQAQKQLVSYPPKPATPSPYQHLEGEYGLVETPSPVWGAPSSTQLSNFASGTNHLSPIDSHSPVYPTWTTAMPWSGGHSTSGILEEPLASFDAIQSLNNWSWGFAEPPSARCS